MLSYLNPFKWYQIRWPYDLKTFILGHIFEANKIEQLYYICIPCWKPFPFVPNLFDPMTLISTFDLFLSNWTFALTFEPKEIDHLYFLRQDLSDLYLSTRPFTEFWVVSELLRRMWHADRGGLLLRTPAPVPFGLAYVLLVETNPFPNLSLFFWTMIFEYPSVISRFCLVPLFNIKPLL